MAGRNVPGRLLPSTYRPRSAPEEDLVYPKTSYSLGSFELLSNLHRNLILAPSCGLLAHDQAAKSLFSRLFESFFQIVRDKRL